VQKKMMEGGRGGFVTATLSGRVHYLLATSVAFVIKSLVKNYSKVFSADSYHILTLVCQQSRRNPLLCVGFKFGIKIIYNAGKGNYLHSAVECGYFEVDGGQYEKINLFGMGYLNSWMLPVA
jgi:hypothetical protein